jgi:hypothetical protein
LQQEEVPIEDFQQPELSEEEAIEKAITESELSRWEGLMVLLWGSALL